MNLRTPHIARRLAAFTMVEIAICLAIIGLALVAIIGVIPIGMNIQRDNREETIINQDASVILESIRNGVRGGQDLTNYIYAITNYWVLYNPNMTVVSSGYNGYDLGEAPTFYPVGSGMFANPPVNIQLTNNANIIGLLSTPEFLNNSLAPTNNLMSGGYSNHVIAYVRALSGPAAEKPPQDNQLLIGDSFTYRILVVNSPLAIDTNLFGLTLNQQVYNHQLAANLHELRLSFFWPVQPNGSLGLGRQTQRALIAGDIIQTNFPSNQSGAEPLYYYQSQSFTNSP